MNTIFFLFLLLEENNSLGILGWDGFEKKIKPIQLPNFDIIAYWNLARFISTFLFFELKSSHIFLVFGCMIKYFFKYRFLSCTKYGQRNK